MRHRTECYRSKVLVKREEKETVKARENRSKSDLDPYKTRVIKFQNQDHRSCERSKKRVLKLTQKMVQSNKRN